MRKGVEPKTIKEKATKKSTTLAPNMRKSDDQKQKEKIEKDKQQYKQMTKKTLSLSPSLNNMLIFRTDKDSNHGFPDKILCPDTVMRKSIALYYYVEENRTFPIQIRKRKYFTTVWKKRPNTSDPEFMDRDSLWRKVKYKNEKKGDSEGER